ncbi:ImmA/IrrE family metallo-endopeptidase [Thermodesulfitimonas sp.]
MRLGRVHRLVEGMSFYHEERNEYHIVINGNRHRARRRTTLAHELSEICLGHLRREPLMYHILRRDSAREGAAFRLGRAILLPEPVVTALCSMYSHRGHVARILRERASVSWDVACLRLRDLEPGLAFLMVDTSDGRPNVVFNYAPLRLRPEWEEFALTALAYGLRGVDVLWLGKFALVSCRIV